MTMSLETVQVHGFLANGIPVGIKEEGRKDLSLLFSLRPAKAVGMFTTNSFQAAPVIIDRKRIEAGFAQAILTNSGNANAATGEEGLKDARLVSKSVSDSLRIGDELVLLASTGIIGQRLPVHKIITGMPGLTAGLRADGLLSAEEAIMTTDKFPKICCRKTMIGGKEVTLCGLAKGAGMISPHMATMLAFFITDAEFEASALQSIFPQTVDKTFNAISVDGCMSTNDTILMLANGAAGNDSIRKGTKGYSAFREILFQTMFDLSQDIVRDGEGATKVIDIHIAGAVSKAEARKAAYAVANSNLVKTAFFGGDPNWGRIISALGSAGISLEVTSLTVSFADIAVFAAGSGTTANSRQLAGIMSQPCIKLTVNLAAGKAGFRLRTSDLGYEYVKINAHYHT